MLVFAEIEVRRLQGGDGAIPMKSRLRRQHHDDL
jgi:hypothetical protein